MVPCFTGDAAFTNALRLDDMAEWTAAVRAGLFGRRKGAMPAAFEHPRFYTVEVSGGLLGSMKAFKSDPLRFLNLNLNSKAEEHHLVQGPEKREPSKHQPPPPWPLSLSSEPPPYTTLLLVRINMATV